MRLSIVPLKEGALELLADSSTPICLGLPHGVLALCVTRCQRRMEKLWEGGCEGFHLKQGDRHSHGLSKRELKVDHKSCLN